MRKIETTFFVCVAFSDLIAANYFCLQANAIGWFEDEMLCEPRLNFFAFVSTFGIFLTFVGHITICHETKQILSIQEEVAPQTMTKKFDQTERTKSKLVIKPWPLACEF